MPSGLPNTNTMWTTSKCKVFSSHIRKIRFACYTSMKTWVGSPGPMVCAYNPSTERLEKATPWGLPVSQPSLISKHQSSKKPCPQTRWFLGNDTWDCPHTTTHKSKMESLWKFNVYFTLIAHKIWASQLEILKIHLLPTLLCCATTRLCLI